MAWMAQGFPNDDVWSVDSREEWRTTFSMVRWNFDFDLNYWLFGLVAWFSLRVREVLGSIPRTALATRWEQILEDFPISFQIVCETFAQHLHDSTICNLDDRDDDDESASWCIRNRHCCRNAVETRSARCARGAICKLRLLHVTAVGFEPTPLRTGAWSQRLRPLGQTVILKSPKGYYPYFCLFFWPPLLSSLRREHCMFTSTSDCKFTCAWTSGPQYFTCALLAFLRRCAKNRAFHWNAPMDYFGRVARDT